MELDRETAERLEARAKARGVSVARLLAEFAQDERSGSEAGLAPPLKVVRG
ncbi:hypothetical protein [Methyloceanibacter superfactus]|uniref:hypothetical protein n=1 Tax=Methyloceanibacter superfactus TaxID=1774969 RepID=UPI001300D4AE|nr:hypothetical protein [Methyloceanibacter superfactus]